MAKVIIFLPFVLHLAQSSRVDEVPLAMFETINNRELVERILQNDPIFETTFNRYSAIQGVSNVVLNFFFKLNFSKYFLHLKIYVTYLNHFTIHCFSLN